MSPGQRSPDGGDAEPPVVSVIIPVKDTAPHLLFRALASVVRQDTAAPIEIVVWNDGSTDGRCLDFLANLDASIVVGGTADNRGISAARNGACRLASGTWFLWLDSDDELPPNAVESLLSATTDRTFYAIGQCEVHLPNGTTELHRNDPFLARWRTTDEDDPLLNTVFAVHGGLVHRHLFEDVDGFDEELRYAELTDWFLRTMAAVWPDEIALVGVPTYRYHKRVDSHSAAREVLDRYRREALGRYAAALGWRPHSGSHVRCAGTGARRYDLVDDSGTVRVRADVHIEVQDPTERIPRVPSRPSGQPRKPAHRRGTRSNVHRVLVGKA